MDTWIGDGRLSWPSWQTHRGQFTHNGHLSTIDHKSGTGQAKSVGQSDILTTTLRCQRGTENTTNQSCGKSDNTDGSLSWLCNVEQIVEQRLIVVLSKEVKFVQQKYDRFAMLTT